MSPLPCCLAVDLGTTALKVAVIDVDGVVHALATRPVSTRFVDGGAEQDATEWWQLLVSATREVVAAQPAAASAVEIVTCTSQYMSLVPVADDGRPTGPVLTWMDGRGAALSQPLRSRTTGAFWRDRHGIAPFGADDITHLLYIRDRWPEVYRRTAFFVEPVDALTARLCGRVTTNENTAFPLLLTDTRTLGANSFDADLVERAGLDSTKLAPFAPVGAIIGPLSAAVAAELGLPSSAVVSAGTIDSATSAIGTGAVGDRCGVVIGTTSVMVAHAPMRAADPTRSLITAPSGLADRYVLLAENGVGGKAVEHVATLMNRSTAELLALAAQAAPWRGQERYLPWLVGSMAPRPDHRARAALLGLSLSSGAPELARAAVEGVALNLAWLLPEVESFLDQPFPALTFGGGAAQSAFWAQVIADACQRPVARVRDPRATNARGAALLAFAHRGDISVADLADRVPVVQVHDPDPALAGAAAAALGQLTAAHAALVSGDGRATSAGAARRD